MLVYVHKLPLDCSNLISSYVKQHMMGIMESSPTSQFHCHVSTEIPNVNVYLVEHNLSEMYSLFHVFSCDQIGEDYSYQSFSADQIHVMHQFMLQANIT